jgi:hypothetical protein
MSRQHDEKSGTARPGRAHRALRVVAALVVLGLALWASLAAYFGPWASGVGAAGLAVSGFGLVLALLRGRSIRPAGLVFAIAFGTFCLLWSRVEPSNDRDWQPDVARLARASIDGDQVTLHDIRNFDYRSETDYTVRFYDATFDLRELESVDLLTVYWMGDAIAHVMLSFVFEGDRFVTVSIETRKEVGESYDTIRGFFRQYELIYVVGDERDLVRLRTNVRKDPIEDVYLYRTGVSRASARRLFLDYLREINSLHERPEFYNTGTTNCTTNVYRHTKVNPGDHHFSWKILLSGYAAEYVYENGLLDGQIPFETLRRLSHVNARAHEADRADDFSKRIRVGLPRPWPSAPPPPQ